MRTMAALLSTALLVVLLAMSAAHAQAIRTSGRLHRSAVSHDLLQYNVEEAFPGADDYAFGRARRTSRGRFLAAEVAAAPVAGPALTTCGVRAVDLLTDDVNCGKCGTICGAAETCCTGFCTDTQSNATHCGACGKTCDASTCKFGVCGY